MCGEIGPFSVTATEEEESNGKNNQEWKEERGVEEGREVS